MKNEQPIWYEPHPVTAERKAEIREAGYRILDAVFAPQGYETPEAAAERERAEAQAAIEKADAERTAAESKAGKGKK